MRRTLGWKKIMFQNYCILSPWFILCTDDCNFTNSKLKRSENLVCLLMVILAACFGVKNSDSLLVKTMNFSVHVFGVCTLFVMGTAVAQWLRYWATNRKVAGSIPDGVIGIFHWHNSSDRTMALGSTQSVTNVSTRRISWGKCGRCVGLTNLPPSCAVVTKSGNLNFL
jgi:hypothetical protein